MEVVAILIFIVIIFLGFVERAKGKTFGEKLASTVAIIILKPAQGIVRFTDWLFTPKVLYRKIMAERYLAHINANIYFLFKGPKMVSEQEGIIRIYDKLKRLTTPDAKLKEALSILEIEEKRWETIALEYTYIGLLTYVDSSSCESMRKDMKEKRACMYNNKPYYIELKGNKIEIAKDYSWISKFIHKALDYFHINSEDWINYGSAVIQMYDIDRRYSYLELERTNPYKECIGRIIWDYNNDVADYRNMHTWNATYKLL
jgi:hypothetical protein